MTASEGLKGRTKILLTAPSHSPALPLCYPPCCWVYSAALKEGLKQEGKGGLLASLLEAPANHSNPPEMGPLETPLCCGARGCECDPSDTSRGCLRGGAVWSSAETCAGFTPQLFGPCLPFVSPCFCCSISNNTGPRVELCVSKASLVHHTSLCLSNLSRFTLLLFAALS